MTQTRKAWMKKHKHIGTIIVRISMALVFLYFGFSQLLQPARFVGWLPPEASLIPISGTTLILFNGVFEVVFGTLLIVGAYTRISAALLGLHLFMISLTMGFTQTAVRDIGLALATLSIVFTGPDVWSLDTKSHSQKKEIPKADNSETDEDYRNYL
ncbi:DoxX family protein [Candidatus Woesearchaeota archaeon]|nr:DoxX family protein [Candidatus Woesearchaeota archaeon]